MTAYAVSSGSTNFSVVPSSSFQVRIAKIEGTAVVSSGSSATFTVFVYPSTTPSGGTALTPLPMRKGAPASTATVKFGGTISGTPTFLHSESVTSDPASTVGVAMNANYTFPFDLILSAGSTLLITIAAVNVVIYFEELRLAWSG